MEPQGPLVVSAAARARLAKWGLRQGDSRGPPQQPAAPLELQAFIADADQPWEAAHSPGQPRRLQHWLAVSAADLRRLGAYDGSLVEAGARTGCHVPGIIYWAVFCRIPGQPCFL